MSTTIKLRRGTTLPSSGLEIGEPLFITTSGSEALHIAKSSTQTIRIGPVRKTATDDTLQDYEYYPAVVNSTLGVVDDVKISEHFLISKYYNNNTFDLNIGDLLDSGDSTHYQFKGALRLYYGNGTVDSIICSGVDTTNYTPLVDGILLSTGNLYTAAQSGTACPVKSTGFGSQMKLYADVTIPTYSAGDDISISNNTINAKDQISFILANVAYDSVANNIVYTQQNIFNKCRRNYSKYIIEENEVGNTWTLDLKFDINDLNVECFLILYDNIDKLQILSKPKIFYRDNEIRTYYNNWSTIANQQVPPNSCYRIEVVVSKAKNDDIYAVLTVTELSYD